MAERKPDSVISLESTAAALRLLCGEFKPWGNGMLVTFEDVNYALSWRRELRATIENLSGIADRLAALERLYEAARHHDHAAVGERQCEICPRLAALDALELGRDG